MSRRSARPWLEVVLCGLATVPLAVVSAAAVRVLEERGDESLVLPWDMGIVPPYLAAALATLTLGTTLQWIRRRERDADARSHG